MAEKGKSGKDFNPNAGPTFKEFLWNPETKEFLGRTFESWVKIVIFYIIFYIALAAFFGFCLYIFGLTLEDNAPKWKLSKSIIGTNPGLGFRPMPDQDKNPESTLIWYRRESEVDRRFWSDQVDNFVKKITNSEDGANLYACDYNQKASVNRACRVDFVDSSSGLCTSSNEYGYPVGEPCIVLKLNKVYGWEPEGYGIDDQNKYNHDLLKKELAYEQKENDMPDWLAEYIIKNATKHPNPESYLSTVWISCDGENPADRENIGPLDYVPQPGIPGYYFPYYNQRGYQTPIVFLKLKKPYQGVLINIECKAWAKNIHPDRLTRVGSVHFELLIDS